MASESAFSLDCEGLATYLQNHIDGFQGPVTAQKFAKGQSNPTYRLDTPGGTYVLRRKPSGELLKSAHAVDREFKVLQALEGSDVPVASALHLCLDESVIGTVFYVMEFVDGRVLWDPALPGMDQADRASHYAAMNGVLANVHSIDVESAGLQDFGRAHGYLERQISLWSRQYKSSETETLTDMEWLIAHLPQLRPQGEEPTSLVHGDFRLDNMMFDRESSDILALVDWELSTLGHPYADLAYQCMQLRMPHKGLMSGLEGLDRRLLGIPSEEEYVASYCSKMNISEIPQWDFYLAFSFFRFAAILQGVKKRALQGNASSEEALNMGAFVAPLAGMAVELMKK